MKWTDELDGEFNGKPCKIKVGVSGCYSEGVQMKDEVAKLGICLGGRYCGNTVVSGTDLFVDEVPDDYKRIDLKFIKEVHQQGSNNIKYVLQPTLDIYVPTDDYDNYEFALKVVLNNYLDADWELVND